MKDNFNDQILTTNTMVIDKIPFPKEEIVVLIDQLIRLHQISDDTNFYNDEIKQAMRTINDALSLLIKSPRLIIGGENSGMF